MSNLFESGRELVLPGVSGIVHPWSLGGLFMAQKMAISSSIRVFSRVKGTGIYIAKR